MGIFEKIFKKKSNENGGEVLAIYSPISGEIIDIDVITLYSIHYTKLYDLLFYDLVQVSVLFHCLPTRGLQVEFFYKKQE